MGADLAVMHGVPKTAMLGTERVAKSVLDATRVIKSIEASTPVMAFKPVTLSPSEPAKSKTPIIFYKSLLFGSMLGS